jgi:lipopolysaccharide transport protein LptA
MTAFVQLPARLLASLLALPALAAGEPAPPPSQELPLDLYAESFESDHLNKTIVLHKVRIVRGEITVEADRAVSSDLSFDDSTWTFSSNVSITTATGHLRAALAEVIFRDNRVLQALIHGSADGAGVDGGNSTPATFEQIMEDSAPPARGQAGSIEYDVAAATVWLRENARLTYDGKEIRAQALMYNIIEQKIMANPEAQGGEDVHITIDPRRTGSKPPQ